MRVGSSAIKADTATPDLREALVVVSDIKDVAEEKGTAITLVTPKAEEGALAPSVPPEPVAPVSRNAARFMAPAADKAAPRQIVLPGLLDARDDKAAALRRVVRQSEQAQSQARQAVTSGRTPSDAERANASPDIRQRLSDREVKALAVRNLSSAGSGGEARGKDRNGGGRGR